MKIIKRETTAAEVNDKKTELLNAAYADIASRGQAVQAAPISAVNVAAYLSSGKSAKGIPYTAHILGDVNSEARGRAIAVMNGVPATTWTTRADTAGDSISSETRRVMDGNPLPAASTVGFAALALFIVAAIVVAGAVWLKK